jgi:hypothetical protein
MTENSKQKMILDIVQEFGGDNKPRLKHLIETLLKTNNAYIKGYISSKIAQL